MSKPFTYSNSYDPNLPPQLSNDRNFLNEDDDMPDHETDESYLESEDDSVIDRNFISNRDLNDEHYPDNDLV